MKPELDEIMSVSYVLDDADGIVVVEGERGAAFDEHWELAADAVAPGKLRAAKRFLGPILADERLLGNVLDAGCGDGVHAEVLEQQTPGGRLRVGVDVSAVALAATRRRAGPDWQLVQASVERLPFEDDVFDVTFSYGVIAYTGEPHRSIAELARVTRPGGLVGVWVAPARGGLLGAAFAGVRRMSWLVGRRGTLVIANCLVPFLGLLPTASGVTLRSAGWRACREVVLVNIAPRQLVFPARADVLDWLSAARLRVVREDLDAPISLWAEHE
jgi:SAM-dependent methyltransferase